MEDSGSLIEGFKGSAAFLGTLGWARQVSLNSELRGARKDHRLPAQSANRLMIFKAQANQFVEQLTEHPESPHLVGGASREVLQFFCYPRTVAHPCLVV
jgi:hypothetical protein